ncbi:hypothetical protein B0H11DRAFT_1942433 [Mycena galericulata]|nr:hypothetical protein B0H11DRAFT_1942433 [Mycena galericulata]
MPVVNIIDPKTGKILHERSMLASMAGFGALGALLGATVGGATYAAEAVLRAPTGCRISVGAAAMQGALRLGALHGGMCAVIPVLVYIDHIQKNERWPLIGPGEAQLGRLANKGPLDVWLSLASQIKARRNYGGICVEKGKDRHGFK